MKGGDSEVELHTPIPNNFKKQAWIFNLGSTGILINHSHERNIDQHTLCCMQDTPQIFTLVFYQLTMLQLMHTTTISRPLNAWKKLVNNSKGSKIMKIPCIDLNVEIK